MKWNEKLNYSIVTILFVIAFSAIAYKVFHIPITHDETATSLHYASYSVWEIMMFPDNWPSNHIFNTLSTKFFIAIFGIEQWAVRLPSLLSFIVLFAGVIRLLKTLFKKDSVFIIPAAMLFLVNSYYLDFFGLTRGYAMASALLVLSISYLISGFLATKEKHIWIAFGLAIWASYANFTLLVFWVAMTAICSLSFFYFYAGNTKKIIRKITLMAFFSLAYLALIIVPLIKMTSTNQFKFWSSKGFFKDTIVSLIDHWGYNVKLPLGISGIGAGRGLVIFVGLLFVIVLLRFFRTGWNWSNFRKPLTISLFILLLTAAINILQCTILQTPNLSGRTALFFYPLFIISIIALLSEWDQKFENKYLKIIFAILLFVLPTLRVTKTYSPNYVREWWYDENNLQVIDFLQQQSHGNKITLEVHWLFHPSFKFYKKTGKTPNIELYPYHKELKANTDATYYYVFEKDVKKLETHFQKIKKFGWDRWLLKSRKTEVGRLKLEVGRPKLED